MIQKIKEVYMCNLTVSNVKIWYEIHYDIQYNQTEVMITYDDDWYQEYDKLFDTYKWYKSYNELKELIISEIERQNDINKDRLFSSSNINTTNIEFNLIYN